MPHITLFAASLNVRMGCYSGVIFISKLHFSIFHLERAFFVVQILYGVDNEDFKIVNEVELLFHVTYYIWHRMYSWNILLCETCQFWLVNVGHYVTCYTIQKKKKGNYTIVVYVKVCSSICFHWYNNGERENGFSRKARR